MVLGAVVSVALEVVGLNAFVRALLDVLGTRTTAYAITDRRTLVVRELFGRRANSIAPSRINTVEHRQRADGLGSVLFRVDDVHGIDASGVQKPGNRWVQDVTGAVRALERPRRTPKV